MNTKDLIVSLESFSTQSHFKFYSWFHLEPCYYLKTLESKGLTMQCFIKKSTFLNSNNQSNATFPKENILLRF